VRFSLRTARIGDPNAFRESRSATVVGRGLSVICEETFSGQSRTSRDGRTADDQCRVHSWRLAAALASRVRRRVYKYCYVCMRAAGCSSWVEMGRRRDTMLRSGDDDAAPRLHAMYTAAAVVRACRSYTRRPAVRHELPSSLLSLFRTICPLRHAAAAI
jgi:hypothetical protein